MWSKLFGENGFMFAWIGVIGFVMGWGFYYYGMYPDALGWFVVGTIAFILNVLCNTFGWGE